MTNQDFGLWAMLAFWASSIGGVALALLWAKSRRKNSPESRELILSSLTKRLDNNEITEQEYQKKIKAL